MKYYSELLNKKFDTERECLEAEQAEKVRKENADKARKDLQLQVETAYETKKKADELFDKLVKEYNKTYGTLCLQDRVIATVPDVKVDLNALFPWHF